MFVLIIERVLCSDGRDMAEMRSTILEAQDPPYQEIIEYMDGGGGASGMEEVSSRSGSPGAGSLGHG